MQDKKIKIEQADIKSNKCKRKINKKELYSMIFKKIKSNDGKSQMNVFSTPTYGLI